MEEPKPPSVGRWQRVKEALADALERPPSRRRSFLDQRLAGQEASLRSEVEELLGVLEEASGSVAGLLEPIVADEAPLDLEGGQVGPYRLIQRLGEGGMGVVYLAARANDYEQRVAVKLLRWKFAQEHLRLRFLLERQILAHLKHQNIAALLDGGSIDGQPYLVMEHVEGMPIDDYCDANRLSVRQRVVLLRKVLGAVDFAHRSLVLHRDLKPGNILVTEFGEPKLLDFGLAKLLSADEGVGLVASVSQPAWMTFEYSSPEQVRGELLTTASDVYSLGVLAYQILAGRRPYELGDLDLQEKLRVVCDQETPAPSLSVRPARPGEEPSRREAEEIAASRATGVAGLERQLRGDLDRVVLKAIAKAAEMRYPSAEQFSDDLQRYLEGRPVRAERATWIYRAEKFVRRNMLAVSFSAGILLISAMSTVALVRQNTRVLQERDRAERVSDFMVQIFRVADPSVVKGNEVTAREILDQAARELKSQEELEPFLRASLSTTLGRVYRQLGLLEEAERLIRSALEIRRKGSSYERKWLMESLNDLGVVAEAQGRFSHAEGSYREALRLQTAIGGENTLATASLKDNLARVLNRLGRYQEAEDLLRQALATRLRLLESDDPAVASSLNEIASLLDDQGKLREAESLYRRALAISQVVGGEVHPETVQSLNNLGVVLLRQGRYDEAQAALERVVNLRLRLHGDDHLEVARARSNLAAVFLAEGKTLEARAIFEHALTSLGNSLPDDHPLATTISNNLAVTLLRTGAYDRAQRILARVLQVTIEGQGSSHPDVATILYNLGMIDLFRGKLTEAGSYLMRASEIWESSFGTEHLDALRARHALALLQLQRGSAGPALQELAEVLEHSNRSLGPAHPELVNILNSIALCQLALDDVTAAERSAREAIAKAGPGLPATSWNLANSESILGEALARQGRRWEAKELLEAGYGKLLASLGPGASYTEAALERLNAFKGKRR